MGITALYRKLSTNRKAPRHAIWPYLLPTLAIKRSNYVWAMDIIYIPRRAACLRDLERCPRKDRSPHQLLQHPRGRTRVIRPNSGRGVFRIAASAFGRRSLTLQNPLTNLRDISD